MNKLKILVSGIFYPLSMMSYFIEALQQRDDVELYTCGPFTGNQIPWAGGMQLPAKYVYTPTVPLPANAIGSPIPFEFVGNKLPDSIDLAVEIDAGWHFSTKPRARIVSHVKTDPHAIPKEFYAPASGRSDFVFCMQTPYILPGEKFLPYGYSPRIHYPEDIDKVYDGCLVGLHYAHRDLLVSRLRARGMNIYYSIGEVYDEYRRVYNSSKVALSWSSLLDTPARVWEAFGMGIALVSNRLPDLSTFFVEKDHYLGFSTVEEAEKQVALLLADDDMRHEMSQNAHRKVQTNGTWDMRIQQILETVRLV